MMAFVAGSGLSRGPPGQRQGVGKKKYTTCMSTVTILDYGAGNVRSLENALRRLGHDFKWAQTPEDILAAEKLIFPGVGSFGAAMENLDKKNFSEPLAEYLQQDRPYLGICLGLHCLFDGSEESPEIDGLGIIDGTITKILPSPGLSVPHMGWNTLSPKRGSVLLNGVEYERFYFVHSFRLEESEHCLAETVHGSPFVSVVQRGNLFATQFHPEKSGEAGLRLIDNFISSSDLALPKSLPAAQDSVNRGLAKRIVACLDVRENDQGDLVVTKGDQYDVRETAGDREVRNLGKPVALAGRYFNEGADEVTFLNITSFRGEPLGDAPMLQILERSSEGVFVPLCIGGGIRDYEDSNGVSYTALEVAARYFRAGADKVSIGSDAVYAAEKFIENGKFEDSSIGAISFVYGAQAVVVSIDPKRVYVSSPEDTEHVTTLAQQKGPNGEEYCWYQCTVRGGREARDIDVVQLATSVESMGAGEILLNCMDADGTNAGYDLPLIKMVSSAVSIPVIASSGAGIPEHFVECFNETGVEAALAAGIFHRKEVSIKEVKDTVVTNGIPVRVTD
ncbi:hypothetical protein NDN08_001393 [Rhodosorus marinus]|uniref:Imidazole glycerol phosphate synthase hisHF n=1 Tax=Rhodosorus marinus TaxID=101924 RepID=A0AAV8UQN4_9RHOD|nr:hypothetical protein NDN08_001393 [Rhodosorus marinus]